MFRWYRSTREPSYSGWEDSAREEPRGRDYSSSFPASIPTGGLPVTSYEVFAMSHVRCVDLRTGAFDVPPQEILTRDSVSVQPSAICPSLLVCSLGDHLSGRGGLLPGKYHQCLPFKIFAKYSVLHSKVSFLCNTNKTKSSV